MRLFLFPVFILAFLSVNFYATAQFPAQRDSTVRSFDQAVNAISIDQENGILYAGGNFQMYGTTYGEVEEFSFGEMKGSDQLPRIIGASSSCDDGNEGWFIAADSFDDVNGRAIIHVAPDHSWSPINYDFSGQGAARFMSVWNDHLLFYNEGLVIYDLTSNTYVVPALAIEETVLDMEVDGDKLYFTGSFQQVNGLPRNQVCAFDLLTQTLLPWNPVVDYFTSFDEIEHNCPEITFSASKIFIAYTASFLLGSEVYSQGNVVVLNKSTGAFVQSFNSLLAAIMSMRVHGDYLYMGGITPPDTGIPHPITRYNIATPGDLVYMADFEGSYPHVLQMDIFNNTLYVSGKFTGLNETPRSRFAAIDLSTLEVKPDRLFWSSDYDDVNSYSLTALAVNESGILLNANTQTIGGEPAKYFAAVDLHTGDLIEHDLSFNHPILDLAYHSSTERVFIIGLNENFMSGGTQQIVALSAPSLTAVPWAYSMTAGTPGHISLVDNKLFIHSYLNNTFVINGQSSPYIASFNPSTLALNPNYFTLDGIVNTMKVYDGKLIMGGYFGNVNGQSRKGIAMLNLPGYTLSEWNPHLENYNPTGSTGYTLPVFETAFSDTTVFIASLVKEPAGTTTHASLISAYGFLSATRLPGFDLVTNTSAGNFQNVRTMLVRDSILYCGGSFGYEISPSLFAGYSLNSGLRIPWNFAGSNAQGGIDQADIYNDLLICRGSFVNQNNNSENRYCAAYNINCGDISLAIPGEMILCENAAFVVEASSLASMPEAFQWQLSATGAGEWINIDDGDDFEQTDQQTLHVSGAFIDMSEYWLRCRAWDACDTTVSNSMHVHEAPDLPATLSADTICAGDSIFFDAAYEPVMWSNGAETGSWLVINAAGNYSVTATAVGGCFSPATFAFEVREQPVFSIAILDSLDCEGAPGTIAVNAIGEGPFSYTFNDEPSSENTFTSDSSLVYVIVHDVHACGSIPVVVEVPHLLACYGCLQEVACNYDPSAYINDTALCVYGCHPCFSDIDGSGLVDVSDLLILMDQFGCVGCNGDLNEDGFVGTNDVIVLITEFGLMCDP